MWGGEEGTGERESEGRGCKGEELERGGRGGTEIVNSMCTTHQSLNGSIAVNTQDAEAPADHQQHQLHFFPSHV